MKTAVLRLLKKDRHSSSEPQEGRAVRVPEAVPRGELLSKSERPVRYAVVVICGLVGLYLLLGGVGHGAHASPHAQSTVRQQPVGTRAGSAGSTSAATAPTSPAIPAICNPLDINCDLSSAANSVANAILNPLQPILDAIDQNPLNFITQTPICLSACPTADSPYDANVTLITFMGFSNITAVMAVSVLVALAGLRIMMARQVGEFSMSIMEYLPRIALGVMAAQLSGYLLQFFIDLENALCLAVYNQFNHTVLQNTIDGIFHLNLIGAGLVTFALAMVLGVMNLLLAWQMLIRLGLLFILIVLAPFGLICLGSDFTLGWGRLWTATFSVSLFIQFIQVVALALGGMLITFVSTTGLGNIDAALLSIVSSIAVLSLVLKIPGMIQNWALRPIAGAGSAVTNAASSVLGVAVRIAATL